MRSLLGTLVILLLVTPLSLAQVPTDEDPFAGPAEASYEVFLGETPGGQTTFAIYPTEITIAPNTIVTFNVMNVGDIPHDFTFIGEGGAANEDDVRPREDNGADAIKTPLLDAGEAYNLTVFFDADFEGTLAFICSVPGHREGGMEGTLAVGGAAEAKPIEEYGVNYLAHWVGIVSFISIFIVLFGVFFLFRYGESKEVADHRTGTGKRTVTAAAAASDGVGTGAGQEKEGFLPSPRAVTNILLALAILLVLVLEFAPLGGG